MNAFVLRNLIAALLLVLSSSITLADDLAAETSDGDSGYEVTTSTNESDVAVSSEDDAEDNEGSCYSDTDVTRC